MTGQKVRGSPAVGIVPLIIILLILFAVHSATSGGTAAASKVRSTSSAPAKVTGKPSPAGSGSTHGGGGSCPDAQSLANIPRNYRSVFQAAARQFHVNPLFLAALYLTENGNVWKPFNYNWDVSGADAHGPMQFIPSTWDEYRLSPSADWNNMHDAVFAAANMVSGGTNAGSPVGTLGEPLQPGTLLREAAIYNSGGGNVAAWGVHAPLSALYTETRNYVLNVHELFVSHFTRSGHPYYGNPKPAHDSLSSVCG